MIIIITLDILKHLLENYKSLLHFLVKLDLGELF